LARDDHIEFQESMSRTDISILGHETTRNQESHDSTILPRSESAFADFDRIQVGDEGEFHKTISADDVEAFVRLTGDTNPLHIESNFAARTPFHRPVVHGMLLAGYVSELVGVRCPGSGALWSQQTFRWPAPVFVGDRIHLKLRIIHKSVGSRTLAIEVKGVTESGKVFMEGEGIVSVLQETRRTRLVPIGERVAFINGACHDTGAAIASALAQAGIAIAVGYQGNAMAAEELCAAIEREGSRAIAVRGDLSDLEVVSAAVRHTSEKFNHPVDILINNCEMPADPREIVQLTWDDIQSALDSHLRSAFLHTQAVVPGMCEQKSGCIINIGSTIAWNCPPAGWTSFVIAKSSLHALTRSLASELGPKGIRVNMVSPGLPDSDSIPGVPDRLRKVQAMQTPLRRLASPADIAAVVATLCSNAGDFITGADIPVCGGFQM
jgi:3-oxoacyl-[acyl-carrier protein] reductase